MFHKHKKKKTDAGSSCDFVIGTNGVGEGDLLWIAAPPTKPTATPVPPPRLRHSSAYLAYLAEHSSPERPNSHQMEIDPHSKTDMCSSDFSVGEIQIIQADPELRDHLVALKALLPRGCLEFFSTAVFVFVSGVTDVWSFDDVVGLGVVVRTRGE